LVAAAPTVVTLASGKPRVATFRTGPEVHTYKFAVTSSQSLTVKLTVKYSPNVNIIYPLRDTTYWEDAHVRGALRLAPPQFTDARVTVTLIGYPVTFLSDRQDYNVTVPTAGDPSQNPLMSMLLTMLFQSRAMCASGTFHPPCKSAVLHTG
jgi:hypothetical protein